MCTFSNPNAMHFVNVCKILNLQKIDHVRVFHFMLFLYIGTSNYLILVPLHGPFAFVTHNHKIVYELPLKPWHACWSVCLFTPNVSITLYLWIKYSHETQTLTLKEGGTCALLQGKQYPRLCMQMEIHTFEFPNVPTRIKELLEFGSWILWFLASFYYFGNRTHIIYFKEIVIYWVTL